MAESAQKYVGKHRDFEINLDCLAEKLLSKGWIITDFLGSGGVGEVFALCQNQRDCTRAIKIESLHVVGREIFQLEVNMLTLAHEYGIAPTVYDYWICHNVFVDIKYTPHRTINTDVGFIVMDRWDGSCADLRTDCYNIPKDLLMDLALKIDQFSYETNLYNSDIGTTNIFIKMDESHKVIAVTCGDWNMVHQKPKNYTINTVFEDLKKATGVNLMFTYYYQLYSKMKKHD